MSAAKHTPGPWEWDGNPCDYNPNEEAPWIIAGPLGEVAVLHGEIHCTHPGDARLIVLAPELLEFAKEVRRTGDTRLASMAIALIAKATGEQA